VCRDLNVKHRSPEQTVATLSGGNQQKVVIAKWVLRGGDVLLFDEPTQGIDVDAKEEVYRLMERLASEGCAVVFVSSEFSELVATCSSVVVMREGHTVDVLRGNKVSEAAITSACYDRTHQGKASHVA
jgi:ribose transport system ATP-binding protein